MDNLENSNSANKDFDKPIPFDDSADTKVSHSPLDLGGSSKSEAAQVEAPKPTVKKAAEKIISSAERITSVKTFFTKLHAGAIDFLDEQITQWLKENPGITIKQTNTTVGEVQAKKTEPNIIVTIWY